MTESSFKCNSFEHCSLLKIKKKGGKRATFEIRNLKNNATVFRVTKVQNRGIKKYRNLGGTKLCKSKNHIFHETASGTYEIDESHNPNWIDINFTDAKNTKGIIEFMDKNTFRIQLTDYVSKPRPVAFDQKEQLVLRKVE